MSKHTAVQGPPFYTHEEAAAYRKNLETENALLRKALESYPARPHKPEDEDDLRSWQEWERAVYLWERGPRAEALKGKSD